MGQRLVVSFHLPESGAKIHAEGRVVRLLADGIGVKFDTPISSLMASKL